MIPCGLIVQSTSKAIWLFVMSATELRHGYRSGACARTKDSKVRMSIPNENRVETEAVFKQLNFLIRSLK